MSSFYINNVQHVFSSTVRVTFSKNPKASDSNLSTDGLNQNNYTLFGPGVNFITEINYVNGDPLSLDIQLQNPLNTGNWTLSVFNVQSIENETISAPNSINFEAKPFNIEATLPGSSNDTAESVLRKFLNPALRGKNWDAIISGISVGEQINWDNARLAFNQLFISSASGVYLERKGAENGAPVPVNFGISDELYRQYILDFKNNKLTQKDFSQLLETFYGPDCTRAFIKSQQKEPFIINNADDLDILIDENQLIKVIFNANQFSNLNKATALEVAAVINKEFEDNNVTAYAISYIDPKFQATKVKIYSGSLGVSSAIRVVGGKAQNSLIFENLITGVLKSNTIGPPAVIDTEQTNGTSLDNYLVWEGYNSDNPLTLSIVLPTWNITFDSLTNTTRFSSTGPSFNPVTGPNLDLSVVQIGNYVNIYGTEFNVNNRGSFPITNISITDNGSNSIQYFEVLNPLGFNQSGVVQIAPNDVIFFNPKKKTIFTSNDIVPAFATFPTTNVADVLYPATSQLVTRTLNKAAYLNLPNSTPISELIRDPFGTVTVNSINHGLSINDWIIVDGANSDRTPADVIPGSLLAPITDYSYNSIISDLQDIAASGIINSNGVMRNTVLKINGDKILSFGGWAIIAGLPTNDGFTNGNIFNVDNVINYDPGQRQYVYHWSTSGPAPANVLDKPATLFDDQSVYGIGTATGGYDVGASSVSNGVWVYQNNAFAVSSNSLNTARVGHRQILDDSVFTAAPFQTIVIGGVDTSLSTPLSSGEKSTGINGVWSYTAPMNIARADHELIPVGDTGLGYVMVCGGRDFSGGGTYFWTNTSNMGGILNSTEIYNSGVDGWLDNSPNMTFSRFGHKLVPLPDGRVLAIGGIGYDPTQSNLPVTLKSCEIFEFTPVKARWHKGPDLNYARSHCFALYLPQSNKIVAIGGRGVTQIEYIDLNEKDLKWRVSSATIPINKYFINGAITNEGDIVLIGGTKDDGDTDEINFIYISSDEIFDEGGLNGLQRVSSTDSADSFTYETPDYNHYTRSVNNKTSFLPIKEGDSPIAGPYIFDPEKGLPITSIGSAVSQVLLKDNQYFEVDVGDTNMFPTEEGYVVFNFGYQNQVGPVKYLAKVSSTRILIDFNFIFNNTININDTVDFLYTKQPFEPTAAQGPNIGSLYLTDSASGRVAAQSAIEASTAAGLNINEIIEYPGDVGLAAAGFPAKDNYKLSDKVYCWGSGTDPQSEIEKAKGK